jgi:hypothetical protein
MATSVVSGIKVLQDILESLEATLIFDIMYQVDVGRLEEMP